MTLDSFTIFPALDLRRGKVVRLAQGDPARQTTYSDDPLTWADRWKTAGAEWLHVVNLDGAFGEDPRPNLQALESLLSSGLRLEFGGGVRDQAMIRKVLALGVERVCLGTAAILDPALVEWAVTEFGPARLAGDIGLRDGKVMAKGWQEPTPLTAVELGQRFRRQGLEWCVLTDVRRDGTGAGVNLQPAVELQEATGLHVVASGGLSRLEEIRSARKSGLAGVILGRALYEGKIQLKEALSGEA